MKNNKKILMTISIIILVIVLCVILVFIINNKKCIKCSTNQGSIEYFNIFDGSSSVYVKYDLRKNDDKYILKIERFSSGHKNDSSVTLTNEQYDKFLNILNKYSFCIVKEKDDDHGGGSKLEFHLKYSSNDNIFNEPNDVYKLHSEIENYFDNL